ncbi:MAG TPA: MoxR family ATPase [Anaeromyxobacteraceae bacterium]|nr:MoxR family ATPase [Anaeromyxobacteraceae bacterium]
MRPEIRALREAMEREGYVADDAVATAVRLALDLEKPLLVEGDAGVGKTEIAKVLARVVGTELIRLQCYEGLDIATAVYEWNYPRQMLRIRMGERQDAGAAALEGEVFSRPYLLERPILRAITRSGGPAVLLVDEVDRADEAFEAFLLEVLSDFQVTVPELGTLRAEHVPHVVLTSNCTREIGDALRRRCLYLHLDHPTLDKEVRILRIRVPGASEALSAEIARFVQGLRARRLVRSPGVAESIDWARALARLHVDHLDADVVQATLGCIVKDRHDAAELRGAEVARLAAAAVAGEAAP